MSALPNPTSSHANAYLRTRVLTASPEELRLMLLDGAIKFCRQGREACARGDFEAQYNGVTQCRNIIFELLTSLRPDLDPAIAGNLKALYTFLYTHLTEASHDRDVAKFDKVAELLEYERETWVLLMKRLAEERVAGKITPECAGAPAAIAETARRAISVQG
jgi:flagellar protein FliS